MLATFSRVTTLHLARALSTAVNDEAVAAQRELDEFFGAEFTGNAEQSPHANAASMLGGLQAPSPFVNLQAPSDSSAKENANLSHVDETGRASMVDVGHVRHYAVFCRPVPIPQVSQERSSATLLSVTPVVK